MNIQHLFQIYVDNWELSVVLGWCIIVSVQLSQGLYQRAKMVQQIQRLERKTRELENKQLKVVL